MLGGVEGGVGGLVEKKKKKKQWIQCRHPVHEGSPCNSLQLIPPDASDTLIYILEKKKRPGFLSRDLLQLLLKLRPTARLPAELSRDSASGRKRKPEKYTPKAQRVMQQSQETAEGFFPNRYQNTQQLRSPPFHLGMWASCGGQRFISRPLTARETTVCLSLWMFSPPCAEKVLHISASS